MSDLLQYEQGNLEGIESRIKELGSRMNGVAQRLRGVNVSGYAGGNSHTGSSVALSGLAAARAGGGSVRDSVRSYAGTAEAYADYARSLAAAVSRVSQSFSDTESRLRAGTDPDDQNGRSGAGPGYGAPGKPDWATIVIPHIDFREILERIRERYRELIEEARAQREAYLEEANKARVLDEYGKYGGNQSDAQYDKANYDRYRDMIYEHTGRRLSDDELALYLEGMASEGCGYMALVNTIFLQYEGRAEEFERVFGFPMYDADSGDLNYNLLMVDLYSETDNHNRFLFWDTVDGREDRDRFKDPFFDYDYYTDTERWGTTQGSQQYRMERYMESHGIEGEVKGYSGKKITVDNYDSYAKDGTIIINTGHPLYMRNQDGSYVMWTDENGNRQNHTDGGHAMVVTGVDTIMVDGKPTKAFKVSSWGRVYYVVPGDPNGSTDFNQVIYK